MAQVDERPKGGIEEPEAGQASSRLACNFLCCSFQVHIGVLHADVHADAQQL